VNGVGVVDEQRKALRRGKAFARHFDQLLGEVAEDEHAGDIASRALQAAHEALLDWIGRGRKNHRYRIGRALARRDGRERGGHDHVRFAGHYLARQTGKRVGTILAPPVFERHVASLHMAKLPECRAKSLHQRAEAAAFTARKEECDAPGFRGLGSHAACRSPQQNTARHDKRAALHPIRRSRTSA